MDFSLFQVAQAAPPPDFIYQAGNQMIQVSSVLVVAFGFVLGWIHAFWVRCRGIFARRAKLLGAALSSFSVLALMGGTWFYHASHSSWQANFFAEVTSRDARAVSGNKLAALLEEDPALFLIDVREDEERQRGFIPGSRHLRM